MKRTAFALLCVALTSAPVLAGTMSSPSPKPSPRMTGHMMSSSHMTTMHASPKPSPNHMSGSMMMMHASPKPSASPA